MIIMMFSFTIIKLLLSGTFLTELFFYALIGYCCKILLDNKNAKISHE